MRQSWQHCMPSDGALTGIGGATSMLALAGLALYRALGWWRADRSAALMVAAIAAVEAWRTARGGIKAQQNIYK